MDHLEEADHLQDEDAKEDQRVEAADVDQVLVDWEPYVQVAEIIYSFFIASKTLNKIIKFSIMPIQIMILTGAGPPCTCDWGPGGGG